MEQITAKEATKLSNSQYPTKDAPPKHMIELINRKIHVACRSGKFFAMLTSFSDSGNEMPHGVHLSQEMIKSIETYYSKLGFKLGQAPGQLWIGWGEGE